jgi:hypothetical protein
MSLTALALVGATAAPAPAVASARPAAHQSVLASTCDPSSGERSFYSPQRWSSASARLCVEVLQRADGSKAIQAHFYGRLYYYWGAAWYADCSERCVVNGGFTLRKGSRVLGEPRFSSEVLSGNNIHATHTFGVDSGHYQVTVAADKLGGYWQYDAGEKEVRINGLTVEIDVP